MRAESVGQLHDFLRRGFTALLHDIGRTKLLCQLYPIAVPAEHDHLLGAKSARGDHSAETNGTIAHNCRDFAGTDLRTARSVMSGTHYIRECEQSGHQLVVRSNRQLHDCAVRLRHPHRFALTAVELSPSPESAVQTRCLQTFPAELA